MTPITTFTSGSTSTPDDILTTQILITLCSYLKRGTVLRNARGNGRALLHPRLPHDLTDMVERNSNLMPRVQLLISSNWHGWKVQYPTLLQP